MLLYIDWYILFAFWDTFSKTNWFFEMLESIELNVSLWYNYITFYCEQFLILIQQSKRFKATVSSSWD